MPTGELPSFLPRLAEQGVRLPGAMYAAAELNERKEAVR
jgi:hypothetical protein